MHHRDLVTRRRRHDVNLRIVALHRVLEYEHREDRRTGRDVARLRRDRVRRDHARAGIALRRRHHRARLQCPRRIEPRRAAVREDARLFTRLEHRRQLRLERTVLRLEGLHHARVVRARRGIDREHAARLAHAHHVLAREAVMHVARERRQPADRRYVRLLVEDRLRVVRHRPALRHVELEKLGELGSSLGCHHVAPGAERRQQLASGIERQIAVHHRADADGADFFDGNVAARPRIGGELCVAGGDAFPDEVQRIRPDAVPELVFPGKAPRGECLEIGARQHGLDVRRAELDAECRLAFLDGLGGFFEFHGFHAPSKINVR